MPERTLPDRLADAVVGRPRLALALLAGAVLALAPALASVRFDSSVERLSVQGDAEQDVLGEAVERFGNDDVLVVALVGDGPAVEPARLARLRRLGDALRAVPGVERVWSLTAAGHVRGTPDGVEVTDLADGLPSDGPALAALRAEVQRSPLYRRHVLSVDGRTAAIVVFPERESRDPFANARLVAGVREALAAYPGPERTVLSGNPAFTVDVARTMESEQGRMGGLTVVVLAAVLALFFRSLRATLLPLAAAGLAVVAALGALSALGRSISVLSTIVPSLVLAVAITYSMHVLHRLAAGRGTRRERARVALRDLAVPIGLSAATTAAGFASLAASRIPAIREFGLLAAGSVAAAAAAVLVVLPAGFALAGGTRGDARPAGAGPRAGGRGLTDRVLAGAERAVRRRGVAVLAASAALVGLAAAGAARLSVDTSYVSFLSDDHPANRDRLELLRHLAGPIPLLVLLDSGHPGGALEPDVLARVAAFEERVDALPRVHASFSLSDVLAEMNRAWHAEAPDPDAFRVPPDGADLASQYLLLYESSDFADDLERLVDFDRQRLAVWVRTELYTSRDAARTVDTIRADLAANLGDLEPRVTGTLYRLFRSSDEIARGQARSLALALAVIGAMVTAVLRSLRLGLLAAVPNVLPILLLFGAMGWLGVPLNVGTSVVACLVLGVATDDTIHFVLHWRGALARLGDRDAALAETFRSVGPPILQTSVALMAAFSVLVLSAFGPIAHLGWLTALTMATCLMADLLLLPVLLRRFGPAPPAA